MEIQIKQLNYKHSMQIQQMMPPFLIIKDNMDLLNLLNLQSPISQNDTPPKDHDSHQKKEQ